MIGSGVCDTGTNATIKENVFIGYEVAASVVDHAAQKNTGIGKACFSALTSGNQNIAIGRNAANTLSTGYANIYIGNDNASSAAGAIYETVVGFGVTGNGDYSQTLGRLVSKSRRMTLTKAHDGVNSVIAEVFKIPALSIIKSVSCVVVTKSSDVNPYTLNLQLSTETGTAADGALVNGSTTITVPEILGAGASATYSQNSATVMGTAADIVAGSGGVDKTTYLNRPNTTIVGTADTYLYVCNDSTANGTTSASTSAVLEIVVAYTGID